MNKSERAAQVADERSTTRAAAERMVEAVFSAICDALARGEPVAIARLRKFAVHSRVARVGRNPQTGEPVDIAASRSRRSRPRRFFQTQSTPDVAQAAARYRSRPATFVAGTRCQD